MVALGLVMIVLGALAIIATVFVNDGSGGQILGIDMSVTTIFLFGVAAGAAVILGYSIMKWGTKRGLAQRKERKELNKISKRLDDKDKQVAKDAKSDAKSDSKGKSNPQSEPTQAPKSTPPPEAPPV